MGIGFTSIMSLFSSYLGENKYRELLVSSAHGYEQLFSQKVIIVVGYKFTIPKWLLRWRSRKGLHGLKLTRPS